MGLAKLARFRDRQMIAHVLVNANSGKAKPLNGKPSHLSFWIYSTFQPHAAVQKYEAVT